MADTRLLSDWLAYIDQAHPAAIELGLDRVREVAAAGGWLQPGIRNLSVAGTNGKGSAAVFAERLLTATGLTVGTTLSPHLNRFNERVRLNGRPVSDSELCRAFDAVERARGSTPLTYFEFAILAAFEVFTRHRVDAAVLEVGLGGRLDAVNVVDADVALITNIDLDHQSYLGDDRESVGREKAGIARAGRPLVYADPDMPNSIASAAVRTGAVLERLGVDYTTSVEADAGRPTDDPDATGVWRFDSPLGAITLPRPSIAHTNAAGALRAVELLSGRPDRQALETACREAALPGRQQWCTFRNRRWLLDVAHNPHGARLLSSVLKDTAPVAVFGTLADKPSAAIADAVADRVGRWLTVPTVGSRGLGATECAARLSGIGVALPQPDLVTAIDTAVALSEPGDVILVFGSFDVVGGALAALGRTT